MERSGDVLGAAIRAAASHVCARLTPGHGPPLSRHLSLLAEVDPGPAPSTWTDAHARTVSAVLVARARTDALDDGIALVTRYATEGRLTRPATLSAAARTDLFASFAEYASAVGWPQIGARYASDSLLFAETPGQRFRALCVVTQALSLNGEYALAMEAIDEARELFREEGWEPHDNNHWLLFGEALVAAARLRVSRLRELAEEFEQSRPDDPYWRFTAGTVRASGRWLDRDLSTALAKTRQLLDGTGRAYSHRLVRDRLIGVHSGILSMQGDPEAALAALEPCVTHPGHAVCFPTHRATPLMHLGRFRELIDTTNDCVALLGEHCLTPLPTLLTRRAVAFLRLGLERKALASMESALVLTERTGNSMIPLLLLPRADTTTLLDRLETEQPGLGDLVATARAAIPAYSAAPASPSSWPVPSPSGAVLTATERALAETLRSSATLTEIARLRNVSLNTVKSQVRSIYTKLGVSTREAAVALLYPPKD